MPSELWTIGHSTRPIEEFVGLLQSHGIQLLVDVRTIPFSRRNPQFHQEILAQSLREAGFQYRHMPALGGRRKTRPDSVNVGWRNEGFRGYADYMQTQDFWNAVEDLVAIGQSLRVAIMCAEAVPWRCHRSLIADVLVIRGWTVHDIISASSLKIHTLTPFAKPDAGRLTYPSEKPSDSTLPLF
ncbi:MAG TPA: DNA repair protein [Nitrospiraceae bacterium]|nr:DNA repair protein [Nitrospiraceae bacterium]